MTTICRIYDKAVTVTVTGGKEEPPSRRVVCVFITAGPIIKLCGGGGRGTVKDVCYEVRRAEPEACVDEWAHHALLVVNARDSEKADCVKLEGA